VPRSEGPPAGERAGEPALRERTPLARARAIIAHHGAAGTAWAVVRRLARPVYQRLDLVFIDLDLATWQPHLLRRGRGYDILEITSDNLATHRPLLTGPHAAWTEEQLALGARIFVALREGRLAALVGTNRRHVYPPWRLTWETAPDETIIHHIHVEPDFRRGAIGGVLVEATLARLKEAGLRRVIGVIHARNRRSLILAENLGLGQYERKRMHRILTLFQTAPRRVEGRRDVVTRKRRERRVVPAS
jgi:RimJ/RimL family protein N-acetyltransferase